MRYIIAFFGILQSKLHGKINLQSKSRLQVVDFFGFGLPDVKKEVMSMHHSHDEFGRLIPQVGDSMVTNLRRPIFTLLEDTGPGVHDTTVSACDQYLYQQQIGLVSRPDTYSFQNVYLDTLM